MDVDRALTVDRGGRDFALCDAASQQRVNDIVDIVPAQELLWLAHQLIDDLIERDGLLGRELQLVCLLRQQRQEALHLRDGLDELMAIHRFEVLHPVAVAS